MSCVKPLLLLLLLFNTLSRSKKKCNNEIKWNENIPAAWDMSHLEHFNVLSSLRLVEELSVCGHCGRHCGHCCCRWWTVSVTNFFLSFFVSPNVSFHHAVLSFVGLIHALSIVSSYVLLFVLHIVSSSFQYRFIHRFDYLYVWTYSIYSRYRTVLFFS